VANADILFDVEWGEANRHCADLELSGFDDWRLPSVTEVVEFFSQQSQSAVAKEIRSQGKGVWTCNAGEEVELFAQPTEGPDVSYHWQYVFGKELVTGGGYLSTSALCVRGGRANCEPTRASPTICFAAADEDGDRLREPVPFQGILKRGGVQELGETNEAGWLCVDREDAERRFSHILGCHIGLCLGVRRPSFDGTHELVLRFPHGNVLRQDTPRREVGNQR
jgi:hypothetical protein